MESEGLVLQGQSKRKKNCSGEQKKMISIEKDQRYSLQSDFTFFDRTMSWLVDFDLNVSLPSQS